MTVTIPAGRADYESSAIPRVEKLPPGPEGEIVTIALAGPFELFRRCPVIWNSELFPVRDVAASS
jgi:hypothetical protein